jgi:hypothetical protein
MVSLRTRWVIFGLGAFLLLALISAASLAGMDWPDRLAIQRFVNAQPGLSDALVDVGSRGGRGANARSVLLVTARADASVRGDAARSQLLQAEVSEFARQQWRGEAVDEITVRFTDQQPWLARLLSRLFPGAPATPPARDEGL